MPTYRINLTFTEPLLGSAPLDKKTYETYILPKAPQLPPDEAAKELASVGNGMDSKGITGFHRTEDGKPILYDYVLKGFAKDACGMMRRVAGSESASLKAYKSVIDGMLFPAPRQIVLDLPADVNAWKRYIDDQNTRRNGNPLAPAFIVGELKAQHRAPEDCYAPALDPDRYIPFVLE